MAVQPLSSATHPGLGGPLSRQLADATQGHPPARPKPPFIRLPCGRGRHPALAGVSARYSGPGGRFPTCYSPVRHWARDCSPAPSDLHVLGTPPAFILSQDRTLKVKLRPGPACCRLPNHFCTLWKLLSVCLKTSGMTNSFVVLAGLPVQFSKSDRIAPLFRRKWKYIIVEKSCQQIF